MRTQTRAAMKVHCIHQFAKLKQPHKLLFKTDMDDEELCDDDVGAE